MDHSSYADYNFYEVRSHLVCGLRPHPNPKPLSFKYLDKAGVKCPVAEHDWDACVCFHLVAQESAWVYLSTQYSPYVHTTRAILV